MPKPVPQPVAAALGLVPAVLDGARRLPGKAVQLPVIAVSTALTALDTAKREYDDLADRGERVIARFRGTSFDEVEDRVEARLTGTPLAAPYDAVEDALEDAVAQVSDLLDRAASKRPGAKTPKARTPEPAPRPAATHVEPPVEPAVEPAAEEPKGEPTPSAPSGSPERVETAASPDVVETVEEVSAATTAPEITEHDQLPLADYDHMTLGSLRGRLRSLSVPELVQLRDYEKAHAARLPVVTLLDNRIAKLATDASATPSPGGGEVVQPVPDAAGKVGGPAAPKKSGQTRTKVRTT